VSRHRLVADVTVVVAALLAEEPYCLGGWWDSLFII
jgi:hypothetical protein